MMRVFCILKNLKYILFTRSIPVKPCSIFSLMEQAKPPNWTKERPDPTGSLLRTAQHLLSYVQHCYFTANVTFVQRNSQKEAITCVIALGPGSCSCSRFHEGISWWEGVCLFPEFQCHIFTVLPIQSILVMNNSSLPHFVYFDCSMFGFTKMHSDVFVPISFAMTQTFIIMSVLPLHSFKNQYTIQVIMWDRETCYKILGILFLKPWDWEMIDVLNRIVTGSALLRSFRRALSFNSSFQKMNKRNIKQHFLDCSFIWLQYLWDGCSVMKIICSMCCVHDFIGLNGDSSDQCYFASDGNLKLQSKWPPCLLLHLYL